MTTPARCARVLPALLLATLALTLVGCADEGEPMAQGRPAVSVTTLTSQPVTLTRELPGRVQPWLVAEVRPQVSGLIAERLFTEGSEVEAGQPLYQIDDATYRATANSARAQLRRAEAAAEAAKLHADRIAELVRIDAVSQQDHDNAVASLRVAQADVGAARAALDAANVTLGHALIRSPISGRIGRSTVTPGALVTANQPQALATVQQLDPIYVDLTQSATELLDLRRELSEGRLESSAELPVTILLEDGTPFPHQGTLAFSEVSVDPATGSFGLRVVVDNPEHILMPGMYMRAVVGSGVRQHAVLVPQRGVTRDPKGNTSVMLVNDEDVVEHRPVVVSRTIGDQWLVEDGLAVGDRVVVEGLQKIQAGIPVQASEFQGRQAPPPGAASPPVPVTAPAPDNAGPAAGTPDTRASDGTAPDADPDSSPAPSTPPADAGAGPQS